MGVTDLMTVAAVLAGAGALGALGAVLVRPGPRPLRLGPRDLAGSVGAGAVVFAVAGVVVKIRGVDSAFFAAFHLVYLGLVISAPMFGVGLVVAAFRRRLTRSLCILAPVLLLGAPIGWYATHWAPFALRVDRAEVALPAARAGTDPVRIGVLSDLQTTEIGSYERRVVRILMAEHPDMIVIPGDLFQGDDAQFAAIVPAYRALLKRLHAPAGVFAVPGDSETSNRLERLTDGTGIRILADEIVTLHVGDRTVLLGGNKLRWAPPEGVAVRDRLQRADSSAIRVLVAHRPEVVRGLRPNGGVDVTIAGHTHGGQVALPLIGPIVTFSPVPRRIAGGGLHQFAGNRIYVSTGAGMVRQQAPQVRFLTRPSVGIVTLR